MVVASTMGLAAANAQCPMTLGGMLINPVPAMPRGMAVADFNQDGIPDVVCANFGPSMISVLLGNPLGNGTFLPTLVFPAGPNPWGVAVGDFNADGLPDIVAANNGAPSLTVLLNLGGGVFQPPTFLASPTGAPPLSVEVADFNKDGRPDLVVSDVTGRTGIMLGVGGGTFIPAGVIGTGPGQCFSMAVGDFNTDGNMDVVVGHFNNATLVFIPGLGNGGFGGPLAFPVPASPTSIAAGDINGDGRLDLAVAWPGGVQIMAGTVGGGFAIMNNVALVPPPYAVALADLDRDGRLDLAVATSGGLNLTALGFGNGFFQAASTYPGGGNLYDIAVSDLNRDGRPDVLTTADGSNLVTVLPQIVPVPTINAKPFSQSVVSRSPVSFTVSVVSLPGTGTMTYQWRRDGNNLVDGPIISGSQTATLTYAATALTDNGGAYDCIVTNGCGSTRSDPAGLEVTNYCLSDIVSIGGLPPPDALVTGDDFIAFINSFATGCP